MTIIYERFSKGSVVVEIMPGGDVHLHVKHRSCPFFIDDQNHGGIALEKADAGDAADCLRAFADSTPEKVSIVAGVTVEWVEV